MTLASCGANIPDAPSTTSNPSEGVTARSITTPLSWSAGPTLPSALSQAGAVTLADGSVVVLGGSSANATPPVLKLSAGATTWTSLATLDRTRIAPGVGVSGTGVIAVFGGGDKNLKSVKSVVGFDTNANKSSGLPSMLTARQQQAFASNTGVMYAIGGIDDLGNQLSSVESFAGGRWVANTALPETLVGASAAFSGQDLFVFGGATSSGAVSSKVYKLSGFPTAWSTVAPMPVAVKNAAVVAGKNNLIYVLGGSNGTTPVSTVQVYDAFTNTWSLEASLPVAISAASAAIDSTGRVLVIGGLNASNTNLNTVYSSLQAGAPPVITSTPPTTVEVNQVYTYQATSTGKPTPTYSLVANPAGMTVNTITGLVSWTPTVPQFGTQTVTLRASSTDGTADQTFSVKVTAPQPTPVMGLVASNIAETSFTLSWNPSTALIGTISYEVWMKVPGICGRGGCGFGVVATSNTTSTKVTVAAGTNTSFYVVAVSSAGSRSYPATSFALGTTQVITVATLMPAPPTNPTASTVTQTSVTLSWTASAGPLPILGYRIYDLDIATATTTLSVNAITGTSATISNLLPNSRHFFRIASFDALIESVIPLTNQLDITTNSPPNITRVTTAIEKIVAVIGQPLMVIVPAQNSTVGQDYVLTTGGSPKPTLSVLSGPAGMGVDSVTGVVSWNPTTGIPGNYTATIRGTNVEGFTDFSFNYTLYAAGTDLLAPTMVSFPVLTDLGAGTVQATWFAATDNVGVTSYDVYAQTLPRQPIVVAGPKVKVGTVTGTNFTLTNLLPNTFYAISVVSRDAAGNSGTVLYPGTIVTLP
jgi:Fibronectin type III domain/Kelch motif/Putative Ig domain